MHSPQTGPAKPNTQPFRRYWTLKFKVPIIMYHFKRSHLGLFRCVPIGNILMPFAHSGFYENALYKFTFTCLLTLGFCVSWPPCLTPKRQLLTAEHHLRCVAATGRGLSFLYYFYCRPIIYEKLRVY